MSSQEETSREASVHRFDPDSGTDDLFIDNAIGYRRLNFPRIGPNTGWEDARRGPIDAAEFVVGMLCLPPGGEAASHRHRTNEVFVALSDEPVVVYWGEDPVREETLAKWDVISIPAGVWRGVRNDGDADTYVLGIGGGADGGGAEFHPDILAKAKEMGFELDAQGRRRTVDLGAER